MPDNSKGVPIRTPDDVKYIADLLDTKFKLSNGWRFGWDGILGLIPGFGNLISDGFSIYIIVRAAMSGCPPSVLLRMGLNVVIDNIVDKVPFLGILFDFMWKSNSKNVELMDRYFDNPTPIVQQSRWIIVATLVFLFLIFAAGIVLTFILLKWLIEAIQTNQYF